MLAAIIIIGDHPGLGRDLQSSQRPWAAVEVLGKAPVTRIAEDLKTVCDAVSVIDGRHRSVGDLATARFVKYRRAGFPSLLIVRCGAYVELDVVEMRSFHQAQGFGVTRAFSDERPLDIWMVDPSALPEQSLIDSLSYVQPAVYRSHGYVNRLQSPHDYRRLVLDSFQSRCRLRPEGLEIKPGVWVCEGTEIARSARVVAPAFLGAHVQIGDDCLITRGSSVEGRSQVDFGTAVEDSSILSNSYVGIGLDLAHSIVDGSNLLNLRHNVNLEITDSVVMRRNSVSGGATRLWGGIESGRMALSSAE